MQVSFSVPVGRCHAAKDCLTELWMIFFHDDDDINDHYVDNDDYNDGDYVDYDDDDYDEVGDHDNTP